MSKREDRLRAKIQPFLKEYGRTSRRNGLDPNDRHYDRAFERELQRMDPRDLDRLMNGTDEDPDEPIPAARELDTDPCEFPGDK